MSEDDRDFTDILNRDIERNVSIGEAAGELPALRHLRPRYYVGAVCILLLALLPALATLRIGIDLVTLNQLIPLLFLVMWAMCWDFVSGYTDQISLGHGAFLAIGAYSSAVLNIHLGLPPIVTIVIGTLVAGIAGILIGIPSLRLKGAYLSLVTLVAPIFVFQMLQYRSDILGGIPGMAAPDTLFTLGSFQATVIAYYYLALLLMLGILSVFFLITRSNTGEVFTAIAESERAVAAVGLNPAKFKVFAFTLSAAVAGLSAAVFVHTPNANPQPGVLLGGEATLGLEVSLQILLVAILGGMGTIVGALAGGFAFAVIIAVIESIGITIPLLGIQVSDISSAITFMLIGGLLWVRPGGVVPTLIDLGRAVTDTVSGWRHDD